MSQTASVENEIPNAADINAAYRLFLGREPENAAAIDAALHYRTIGELRRAMLSCSEFQSKGLALPSYRPLTDPPNHVEWKVERAVVERALRRQEEVWHALGKERPHWSVLSSEQFLPEQIDLHSAAFYESGLSDCDEIRATLERTGLAGARINVALEFGCGIGRVTAHLARMFPKVIGCDISRSHLALAQERLGEAGVNNVVLKQVDSFHLGMDDPFDFFYSKIVLQHNKPPLMALIIERALSRLSNGGIAIFQLPTYALGYTFDASDEFQSNEIEMHVLPQSAVFELCLLHNCKVIEVRDDDAVGIPGWISSRFVVKKET